MVELTLIAAVVLTAGVAATGTMASRVLLPESRFLRAAYGPDTNSEHNEEWIVRDFFGTEKGGFFVDVGANDYRRFSNTYYLETALEWSGLAIDPLPQFEAGYVEHRPRTRFRKAYVSDASNEHAKLFYLEWNPLVTSSEKTFTERWGGEVAELDVPTITLNDLLEAEQVTRIDFLSMDIELAEPKALAGFDIERFRPRLVCVEGHPEVRQEILGYFARHGYVLVGKYLRADTYNLWFMPAAKA